MERFGEAYLAQCIDFVDRVSSGREPAVTGRDARAALEIGLAADQSCRQERPVELAELRSASPQPD
jgi:myo-inositol 2-dehydrogenase/D-chiro-inositol 1-dehydrogenase